MRDMAYKLRNTCQKGLHLMVEGNYRLETSIVKGKPYVVRRCLQCQSDRVSAWYRKNRKKHDAETVR